MTAYNLALSESDSGFPKNTPPSRATAARVRTGRPAAVTTQAIAAKQVRSGEVEPPSDSSRTFDLDCHGPYSGVWPDKCPPVVGNRHGPRRAPSREGSAFGRGVCCLLNVSTANNGQMANMANPAIPGLGLNIHEKPDAPVLDEHGQRECWITILALIAGLIVVFSDSLWRTLLMWLEPQYQFGFVVPIIAGILIWTRRQAFREIPASQRWIGVGLITLGMAMRVAGGLMTIVILDNWAFIPCLMGVFVLVGGLATVRWAGPAILFLILMYPFPRSIEQRIMFPLQKVATKFSTVALVTMGVDAFHSGDTQIILATRPTPMNVAEQCSGLRMLTVFTAMAVAFCALCDGTCLVGTDCDRPRRISHFGRRQRDPHRHDGTTADLSGCLENQRTITGEGRSRLCWRVHDALGTWFAVLRLPNTETHPDRDARRGASGPHASHHDLTDRRPTFPLRFSAAGAPS